MSEETKGHVLIVDDEEDVREIISHYFSKKGYSVDEAESGNKAIVKVESNTYDLVVTDCRMADGSGIDLIQHIQKMPANRPPVIMVSGFSDVAPKQVIEMGAKAFIEKPIDRKALLKVAEEVMLKDLKSAS